MKISVTKIEDETTLNENECLLLEQQLDLLLDKATQKAIYLDLIDKFPHLEAAFKMVNGIEAQASFVCKMMHKGYLHIYNLAFTKIHEIFSRHPSYNVTKDQLFTSFDVVLHHVLQHKSITESNDETLPEKSKKLWTKCNQILREQTDKAYKSEQLSAISKGGKSAKDKKRLQANRNRIARSMTEEDIETVTTIWKKLIQENQERVGELLAVKIQKQKQIYVQFEQFGIDVHKQSSVLIDMLDKAIDKLQQTDELVPWLKQLGSKHKAMKIKPNLLAMMKQIIFDLIKDILSFNFTSKTKDSWNKVLTFIVGTMMMEYSNKLKRTESPSQQSRSHMTMDSAMGSDHDSNDIAWLEDHMTDSVITMAQETWKIVNDESMIHGAVKVFYTNLLNTKAEIKALFSKANMAEQSLRLVRAIGSTVALADDLDTLVPILQALGKRHVYYGVKPEHFNYVKKSWFKMLKQALTLKWNREIQSSWMLVWDYMTYWMKVSLEDALLLYVPPDPIQVNFKVLINHIDQVKLADLSYWADIWFAAYTGEVSSQSYAFGTQSGGKKDAGGILPFGGVRCLNAMETQDKYRALGEPYIRYFEEDESYYLRSHTIGTFAQLYDVQKYPFDTHQIVLTFALEVDDTIAMFNEDKISVRLMPFKLKAMGGTIFNIGEPKIELAEMSAIEGGSSSGKRYTQCKITIPISRDYNWYIFNIFVPLLAIEFMCFAVYFTEIFPTAQRLVLSFTLFLTLFSFRREVIGTLPPTPYLTILDHAFNGANMLSVYHVAAICLANQFSHTGHSETFHRSMNWISGIIGFILFCVIHTWLYLRARYYISLYPKEEKKSTGENALAAIARTAAQSRETSMRKKGDFDESCNLSFHSVK